MEDKSLSLWKIPLGRPQKKNNNHNGFQFGETKMEYYKENRNKHEKFEKELKLVFKNH